MYQRIRDLREDNDFTQKDVANHLSFTHSAYAKIERGERILSAEVLIKLSNLYEVSIDYEKVQIDLKYVPATCLKWDTKGKRYYQITAIDEYSRKRVCQIVDEKSVANTATFLLTLEEKMGFKIHTVQTDNVREFANDPKQKERESLFEEILRLKGIRYKKTRPYSPW